MHEELVASIIAVDRIEECRCIVVDKAVWSRCYGRIVKVAIST